MQPAEIKFLGVWDTVPGSSFKKYGYCKEHKGFVKKYFYWLIPGVDKGERYKTDSYPPIRQIAHAVSLDEKRSMFQPVLLCPAINANVTKLDEVWFPGAHADVGGGYDDSDELPGISLQWMLKMLAENYEFRSQPPSINASAIGLAHWSIGDEPANFRSDCVDREIPAGATIDRSFDERRNAKEVPIRVYDKTEHRHKTEKKPYPLQCPGN